MDQVFDYLFKQGLGYVLFIGAAIVAYRKDQALIAEKDRNAQAMKDIISTSVTFARDNLNQTANFQQSINNLTTIISNNKKK